MQVFEIGDYTIAAENADDAFAQFLEESNYLDDVFIGNLNEGESETFSVTIHRLNESEVRSRTMVCCAWSDCELCHGKNEPVYVSCEDLIAEHTDFPCVIAREF